MLLRFLVLFYCTLHENDKKTSSYSDLFLLSRYLISLGKPANDGVSPVLFGWREATTGDTVCLLSQDTPWRSSVIFFYSLQGEHSSACSYGILVLTQNLVLARKKSHLKLHPLVIFLPVEDGARGTGHSQSMKVSSILADL